MYKFTLAIATLACFLSNAANAQTAATFEDLPLSSLTDTFYVNYSNPGNDVGFYDGLAYFPSVYDTASYMGAVDSFWSYGFSYSSDTVSATGGYANQYAAKPGKGYNSSKNYAIAYGVYNQVNLSIAAQGKPVTGFYATNSSYAYFSMLNGDPFAKKFGGATGNDPDFFKITIKGFYNGSLTKDSVDFYLADYRSATKYILDTWQWVSLKSLGNVDSLQFHLSSSDNGQYGMNTPAYFCMDNFTTNETNVAVNNVVAKAGVKVYPNPATNVLNIEKLDMSVQNVSIINAAGSTISSYEMNTEKLAINIASLPVGIYFLQISGNGQTATGKFIKQ